MEDLLRAAGLPEPGAPASETWVVVADHTLLACASYEQQGVSAYLRSLAVQPHARSRGHGVRLVEQLLARSALAGVEDAWLLTTTAEAFFARRGFVRVSRDEAPEWLRRHEHYASVCPSSAALMRRAPASPDHLFVYGTLRRGGGPAAQVLARTARRLGPATMPGRVRNLKAFPAAQDPRQPQEAVRGEVYALPRDAARRAALFTLLDAYERAGPDSAAPLPFARRHRLVRLDSGPVLTCAVYLWTGASVGPS